MTQQDGHGGPGEFEYSEAAMDEWRASRRRQIRPVLVFLPVMILFAVLHTQMVSVPIVLVGIVVTGVMIVQNGVIGWRADRRLKAEKREWEAKHREPS